MKNIFIEGVQGMGKSTLVSHLSGALAQLRVCREGDYSPVDLAWCAWMTPDAHAAQLERFAALKDEIFRNTVCEGEHRIVTYTKIRTDDRSVYKAFEDYEIYNGRKTLEEFKRIVLARYAAYRETDGLFECALFQNIIEELILYHQLSDNEIVAFYRELWKVIDEKRFLLLYLYSDKVESSIETIRRERCDSQGNEVWYQMMMEFLAQCPYGRAHGCGTFEDLAAHFRHRQQVELRIIREVIGSRAVVLPAKRWALDDVLAHVTD